MDPFRLCVALGPVAVYVLLLGALNLSRRAFLVTGTRDAGWNPAFRPRSGLGGRAIRQRLEF